MNNVVMQAKLWYWQRLSAMVLAVCVLVHLGVMIYAVRGGLTGAEILARTKGNWAFGLFYAVFVLACTVHVPIGLAKIIEEWLGWRGLKVAFVTKIFALALLVLGLRSVYAVVVA